MQRSQLLRCREFCAVEVVVRLRVVHTHVTFLTLHIGSVVVVQGKGVTIVLDVTQNGSRGSTSEIGCVG